MCASGSLNSCNLLHLFSSFQALVENILLTYLDKHTPKNQRLGPLNSVIQQPTKACSKYHPHAWLTGWVCSFWVPWTYPACLPSPVGQVWQGCGGRRGPGAGLWVSEPRQHDPLQVGSRETKRETRKTTVCVLAPFDIPVCSSKNVAMKFGEHLNNSNSWWTSMRVAINFRRIVFRFEFTPEQPFLS